MTEHSKRLMSELLASLDEDERNVVLFAINTTCQMGIDAGTEHAGLENEGQTDDEQDSEHERLTAVIRRVWNLV